MKNAVIGFILIVILVLSGLAINTAGTQKMRQNELDASLGRNLKKSLEILKVDETYQLTEEELVADAIQSIMKGKADGSDLNVKVYQADPEEGVLDIGVKETFGQVIGQGTVSARKKLVYEQWKSSQDVFYKVKFRDGGDDTVKEVECKAEEHLTADILPQLNEDGHTVRWELISPANGRVYTADNIADVVVVTNLIFEARRQ